MTILVGTSQKFLDWLNECPVRWFLVKQTNEDLTYVFDKEDEEDE